MKNIIKLLVLVPLFSACDDLFTPAKENIRELDAMYKEPSYAQGILANAYILLPYSSAPNSDAATDDAVTNDNGSNYLKMATGSWSSVNDPMSQWQGRKNAIQYLNIFLENVDEVEWASDEVSRIMFTDRMKGEAYGLRAVQMYYLLMAHGGWVGNELLGVPIVTKAESSELGVSDFNVPRNTYQECVDQILDDAKKAIELLPLDFNDVGDADVPAKYQALGITNASSYNRVFGDKVKGRMTARIAEAVRAQVALLAASPAYSAGTTTTWTDAANYAGIVLDRIGGVGGLSKTGGTWYAQAGEIGGLKSGANPAEIIWRDNMGENNDLEKDNFPPSIYGKGRINPTQNLVDAFPTKTGYPIAEAADYDPTNPYENRDPRLKNYIVVNEDKQGPGNAAIVSGTYGDNNDALNKENGLSTRTGYYLRKLLRSDCNVNPQYDTKQKHYTARIRYTELFLIYAEAANEAYGPTGKGTQSYSAYDVIKAIRERAGIADGDAYLESVKNNQDKMRELIRNERRLELCFENRRFWDLRRWKANLTETARGMQIGKEIDGTLTFAPINVENRVYDSYMYYGPIPYNELRKWDQLTQNDGWQ